MWIILDIHRKLHELFMRDSTEVGNISLLINKFSNVFEIIAFYVESGMSPVYVGGGILLERYWNSRKFDNRDITNFRIFENLKLKQLEIFLGTSFGDEHKIVIF